MINGLTNQAHRVLRVLAVKEAGRFNSTQLLPEHLVLSIIRNNEGYIPRLLQVFNVDLLGLIQVLEDNIPKETGGDVVKDPSPSERVNSVLHTSAEEASRMGKEFINTEHFFLAAALEKGSCTAQFLNKIGLTIEVLRGGLLDAYKHIPKKNPQLVAQPNTRKRIETPGNKIKMKSYLSLYGIDLTEKAAADELDPVIGRDNEIERMMRILARRRKNNPVLVGEPGVGKTSVVEGLANKIVSGEVSDFFLGKKVYALDLALVVAGTKYRGEFEDRIKKIIQEVSREDNIILFIDEIHSMIGAGSGEGTLDASNIFKPALARGEIQCIGATTFNEFKKYMEKDAALTRRFQKVLVEEPTKEDAIKILQGLQPRYESYHHVRYTDEALRAAVNLSSRYMGDRFLPDKAIDLLDEAGARKTVIYSEEPEVFQKLREELDQLNKEKNLCVQKQEYEEAAGLRDLAQKKSEELTAKRAEWHNNLVSENVEIDSDVIRELISDNTGIPVSNLDADESRRLLRIEDELHKKVVGQDEAIRQIASAIRRSRTDVGSPDRTMGTFIFVGSSGVGKSLLAATLAEYLFGSKESLVRVDMSDYMERHSASRLVGAPPGYVGYEEGGFLTEKVRQHPYSVILLDEIEKGHPEVFNLLLQIMEEGEIQDNLGHVISFRNVIIVMTSNAGSTEMMKGSGIGFSSSEGDLDSNAIKSIAKTELKNIFRPEFLNRIDDTIIFHPLSKGNLKDILDLLVAEIVDRLAKKDILFKMGSRAKDFIVESCFDARQGARALRRELQNKVEDPLSIGILKGEICPGYKVTVGVKKSKIYFTSHPVIEEKEKDSDS